MSVLFSPKASSLDLFFFITFADTLDLISFIFTVAFHWRGFCFFIAYCLLFFFLTIMNDDIRSMHGGAQHGLRISAFWLLASGSCSRSRFVFCFCIASEISLFSGVWFFFFYSLITGFIWRYCIYLDFTTLLINTYLVSTLSLISCFVESDIAMCLPHPGRCPGVLNIYGPMTCTTVD